MDTEYINKLSILIMGPIIIDTIFHANWTEPFETGWYFLIKGIILFIVGNLLLKSAFGFCDILKYGLIFMFGLSIYYRILEVVFDIPFGARVPDINFREKKIKYKSEPIQSSLVWGYVHLMAFIIPSLIVKNI